MPITIKSATHPASAYKSDHHLAQSAKDILKTSSPTDFKKCKTIIQSSYEHFTPFTSLYSSDNGLVRGCLPAYNTHQHLTLRPEDVWFSILAQLSLYINAHAEELRSFFVAHKNQEELKILVPGSSIHDVDFSHIARRMSDLLAKKVNDPELHPWIMPAFSTTTENDKAVASILMMGALQTYYSYVCVIRCGIPTVTLLRTREDRAEILRRLEKLPNLGAEAADFYTLLKPVVARMVTSFDTPESEETKDFWGRIVHQHKGGSGPDYLSGWLTAFCFWDQHGKRLDRQDGRSGCQLDGVRYHCVEISDIPRGTTSVPVTVDDNGVIYDTIMVAGSMGIQTRSSGDCLNSMGEPEPDSLQPEVGWVMYEKIKEDEKTEEKEEKVRVKGEKKTRYNNGPCSTETLKRWEIPDWRTPPINAKQ